MTKQQQIMRRIIDQISSDDIALNTLSVFIAAVHHNEKIAELLKHTPRATMEKTLRRLTSKVPQDEQTKRD